MTDLSDSRIEVFRSIHDGHLQLFSWRYINAAGDTFICMSNYERRQLAIEESHRLYPDIKIFLEEENGEWIEVLAPQDELWVAIREAILTFHTSIKAFGEDWNCVDQCTGCVYDAISSLIWPNKDLTTTQQSG